MNHVRDELALDSLISRIKYTHVFKDGGATTGTPVAQLIIPAPSTLPPAFFNNTSFDLVYLPDTRQLITHSFIPAGTYLGAVEGQQRYIYELGNDYENIIFVEDELVIDTSAVYPKNIIWKMKYGEYEGVPPNCKVRIDTDYVKGESTIGIVATKNIMPGDELSIS